jgi:hypothetical protein
MAEIDHPRLRSASASTSSPLEIMRQGSLRLTGLDTVSLGGAPLRLADSDFRQEELRGGGFQ